MPKIGVKVSVSREYQLLTLLQDYAPDAEAQQKCSEIYWELQKDNGYESPKTERALIGILHDGVAHANWPWTDYTIPQ